MTNSGEKKLGFYYYGLFSFLSFFFFLSSQPRKHSQSCCFFFFFVLGLADARTFLSSSTTQHKATAFFFFLTVSACEARDFARVSLQKRWSNATAPLLKTHKRKKNNVNNKTYAVLFCDLMNR